MQRLLNLPSFLIQNFRTGFYELRPPSTNNGQAVEVLIALEVDIRQTNLVGTSELFPTATIWQFYWLY